MLLVSKDPTFMLENRLGDSASPAWVNPSVWTDGNPGRAKNTKPIKIRLKEGTFTHQKKQYPLKKEA